MVVTGDATQVDLPSGARSGLRDAAERLASVKGVSIVELDETDVVRHPLVTAIIRAYGRENP
jgi:phosphate starvation-inducible PhoH-like protein